MAQEITVDPTLDESGNAGRAAARTVSVLMAGDVITQPFNAIAREMGDALKLKVEHYEIDQIHQVLAGTPSQDVLIVHTTADFFLDEATPEMAVERMDSYCHAVESFASRVRTLVIVNTLERGPSRIVGTKYLDEVELVASLNHKLFELAKRVPTVSVVDAAGVIASVGVSRALNLQNRFAMRMPYTKPALEALCAAYAEAIRERYVVRKKVVVVDADNCLWGGIVGEDGLEGIAIDRQYPGSVHRRFQSQLLDLSHTGILLALVSKNNPGDVQEVFERRDMPLKADNFSSMQVNWEAKSDNILRVARELNVGLESLIFIDDNPFELEQVKAALPDVDVYHFEAGRVDKALGLLASIPGLKGWSITAEDRKKAEQYRDERKRTQLKETATSLEDYLRSLDIKLKIGRNRKSQIQRIAQLTNKTNQFNLTTRRYSETDVARFMQTGTVLDVALSDRFGDMGVICVAIVLGNEIDTFLMSCRALGRGVETRILSYICERFGSQGMQAAYVPTAKNMMTAQFYDSHGFELVADDGPKGKRYRLAGDCAPGAVEIPIEEVEGGA